MDTYKTKVLCRNCGYKEEVEVEKGTTVKDWLVKDKNQLCPSCGCLRIPKIEGYWP